ncbi:XAP5, circadian clock regulator-domain-containing protein [Dunaliella salina]|uniref:XAP5, circadian clock regulator-domain-containing protein n=1 Tax=Dunaliella salina TaxID=3046 RepID=A0ABQ7H5J1_DUNSA|nr:XAP5, circadian clock regulator-domain-containing protein [Dunaliella salina]|eukprot:KAF5842122.1 XAP5, circadian clock regulator-domain-containing protein [Dunaliella salina]
MQALQKEGESRVEGAGLRQFSTTTTEALEHAFKNETIGLVTKEEFIKKRMTLAERMEEELKKKQEAEEAALAREKERKRLQKQGAGAKKLSFAMDDEEELQEEPVQAPSFKLPTPSTAQGNGSSQGPAAASNGKQGDRASEREGSTGPASSEDKPPEAKRPRKLGKNPNAPTDFLPDRDRARKEQELREQLKKEYQAQVDKVKAEPLVIVYSYWDGTGHRREVKIKKGDTISGFLKAVREQLVNEFRELRHVSVDNLIYVKEDIILPHHYTFYDLIASKARGKSGPLFDFGVHEDIRVVNDASREKNESHAGKVVERHWYDRNKHIFPASRWEVYDPERKYETYTVHGGEVH